MICWIGPISKKGKYVLGLSQNLGTKQKEDFRVILGIFHGKIYAMGTVQKG